MGTKHSVMSGQSGGSLLSEKGRFASRSMMPHFPHHRLDVTPIGCLHCCSLRGQRPCGVVLKEKSFFVCVCVCYKLGYCIVFSPIFHIRHWEGLTNPLHGEMWETEQSAEPTGQPIREIRQVLRANIKSVTVLCSRNKCHAFQAQIIDEQCQYHQQQNIVDLLREQRHPTRYKYE